MDKKEMIDQLKCKLKDAWLRGKAQRIEIGTLLLELRKEVEHGEWGKVLAELKIPTTTAADYIQEASRQIHGFRKFEGGKVVVDSEAAEMQHAVASAAAEVARDNSPEPPANHKPAPVIELSEHVRVKGPVLFCSADQKAAFKAAKKENPARVYSIFQKALLESIGGQEEVSDETLAA